MCIKVQDMQIWTKHHQNISACINSMTWGHLEHSDLYHARDAASLKFDKNISISINSTYDTGAFWLASHGFESLWRIFWHASILRHMESKLVRNIFDIRHDTWAWMFVQKDFDLDQFHDTWIWNFTKNISTCINSIMRGVEKL